MKQYKNKDWLNQKYWNEKLSPRQIAKLCNCNNTTIWRWLKKLNIFVRSWDEADHLARGNHCNLSYRAKQWIDGELMGDGCLWSYSKYSANFRYGSKYLEYINYVSDTLKSFGIKQAGKIRKYKDNRWNCYTYQYASLNYPELLSIHKRWYPKGKKIIPRDLKLTPLICRQWYIGDESLIHRKNGRPCITLYTNGFSVDDVEWLVKELNELGFKSTRKPSDNAIRISVYSTKQFLNYIGKCPVNCYQYKWDYQEQKNYYQRNKEKILKQAKERYQNDREKYKERSRKYKMANPEKCKLSFHRWYEAHKIEYNLKRKRKKINKKLDID